jgi:hypothetical protein
VAAAVLLCLFVGIAMAGVLGLAGVLVGAPFQRHPNTATIVLTAIVLGGSTLIELALVNILRRDLRFGPGWKRMARLTAFSSLNHMTYELERKNIRYNGAIFSLGTRALATDVMTVKSGRGIQIGNYRSFASSSRDQAHFRGGYVAIELDRRMPHMIAIAKRRRKPGGQSIAPGLLRNQILSLEGDFDKYFTLYAPRQYERDALYVFTPDLMVLLIDRLASFDLEIVDNRLYIYSHKPFDLLDPMTHERLASIVQVVGHKATNQTHRYSDDRAVPGIDIIAPGGRRLRRGATVGVVVTVLYLVFRIVIAFHGF